MHSETFTAWRKSRYSEPDSNCVEVSPGALGNIGVRDSSDTAGPRLTFTAEEWRVFLAVLKTRAHAQR